jgi:hypothetical protein
MALGFQTQELMQGTHHFVDPSYGPSKPAPMYFRIYWGQHFSAFLSPSHANFLRADATGVISVDGLTAGEIPTIGALDLRYFSDHVLRYELQFNAKGQRFTYVGQKQEVKLWKPWLLPKTHTTCYGSIADGAGKTISRSVLHFSLAPQNILFFLKNFRLQFR